MSKEIRTDSALSGVPSPSPEEEAVLSADEYRDLEFPEDDGWFRAVGWVSCIIAAAFFWYMVAKVVLWVA